ncbi:hypothetical protein AWC38_SpisGene6397 [Stylophora pistillata]|uniref:Helix-turn-helix domain-containing protein n=1 Tax=Stylophora pistillata TaxID=50429 RepID=A0A2B4SJ44_STYPI|nr:hypothetical protein AWC38_SpisGene6397 [Stylophora pistillata]
MLNRAYRLSSTKESFTKECQHLKRMFTKLKYPVKLINSAIAWYTSSTIQSRHETPTELDAATQKPVRITLPFKDQKSADTVRHQLKDLGRKIGTDLQPVFTSLALPKVNQPTLSNAGGTRAQNNLQPGSDFSSHGFTNQFLRPSAASSNVDMIKPQNTAATVALQHLKEPVCNSKNTSAAIMTQYDLPTHRQSATSTNSNVTNPQVPLPGLNQSTCASNNTITTQYGMLPCCGFQVQESNIPGPGSSAASTSFNVTTAQEITATVPLPGLNQSTCASNNTITTQYGMLPCCGFQVQESNIPGPGSSAASTSFNVTTAQEITATVVLPNLMNQSALNDTSAPFMVQNDQEPWNDFPMEEGNQLPLGPSAACVDVDIISQTIAAAADWYPDFKTLEEQWREKIPDLSDNDVKADDLSPHEDENFNFNITPHKVPLKGADYCRFESDRALPGNVQTGSASFGMLGDVEVERFKDKFLIGMKIPRAEEPGRIDIHLFFDGKTLGKTDILFYDEDDEAFKRVIKSPILQVQVLRKCADNLENHNTATCNGGEAQNLGICGE